MARIIEVGRVVVEGVSSLSSERNHGNVKNDKHTKYSI